MTQWVKDNDFLNKVLFVPPPPSYDRNHFPNRLVWLGAKGDRFPCLMLFPPSKRVNKVIIYFHGNGCDLGGVVRLLLSIMYQLNVGIVAPEYPGYGLSEGSRSCESSVKNCAKLTLEFVVNKLKVPLERIVIFGTSIGTGAACWLAAKVLEKKRSLGALVLQSPFLSIKAIIKQVSIFNSSVANFFAQVGSNFIADRFMNLQAMKGVEYPLLVFHGINDELIPASHSKTLFDASTADLKQLVLFPDVGHNDFNWNLVIKKLAFFFERVARYYNHERMIEVQTTSPAVLAFHRPPEDDIERLAQERVNTSSRISEMLGSTVGTVLGSAIGVAQSLTPEAKEPEQSFASTQVFIPFNSVNKQPTPVISHNSPQPRRNVSQDEGASNDFNGSYLSKSVSSRKSRVDPLQHQVFRRKSLQNHPSAQVYRQSRRVSAPVRVSDRPVRELNNSQWNYQSVGSQRDNVNTSQMLNASRRVEPNSYNFV